MKIGRWTRIWGTIILFMVPVCWLVEHWKYAGPAIWTAIVMGIFCGEAWHRWREGMILRDQKQ